MRAGRRMPDPTASQAALAIIVNIHTGLATLQTFGDSLSEEQLLQIAKQLEILDDHLRHLLTAKLHARHDVDA